MKITINKRQLQEDLEGRLSSDPCKITCAEDRDNNIKIVLIYPTINDILAVKSGLSKLAQSIEERTNDTILRYEKMAIILTNKEYDIIHRKRYKKIVDETEYFSVEEI